MIVNKTTSSDDSRPDTDDAKFETIIRRCQDGCRHAQADLASYVHDDFYRIARRLCAGQAFANSLNATNLVNETFLRLLRGGVFRNAESSGHLFGVASKTMRNVIIDYLRRKNAVKRSPQESTVYLDRLIDKLQSDPFEFEDLNEAILLLENKFPRRGKIVNMKFFFNMSMEEISEVLSVSKSTVEKEWSEARAWLFKQLQD